MSDQVETSLFEPCYCRKCNGARPVPCQRKVWSYLALLKCWLSGYHFDPAVDRLGRCKKCRTMVKP